jgi:sulfonate transport system ATP-binding protein
MTVTHPDATTRDTRPSAAEDHAVRVRDLTRHYGPKRVLSVDDLAVEHGEFVCLIGRSGSGKSTLLRALAGLDADVPGTGHLTVPAATSVLFQDSRLLPWLRVLANVTLGLRGDVARTRAAAALDDVGLGDRTRAFPNALSGGEQQRVALARSLVREPALLLADEPFGALDALTRIRMHRLLRRLVAEHRPTVVMVTHDVDEALALGERILVLHDGEIVLDHRPPTPRTPADGLNERRLLLSTLGVEEQLDQETETPA